MVSVKLPLTYRDLARLQGSIQIIQTQKTLKIYDK